jgi:hypothetical protein
MALEDRPQRGIQISWFFRLTGIFFASVVPASVVAVSVVAASVIFTSVLILRDMVILRSLNL